MHERSIIAALLQQVAQIQEEHAPATVTEIALEVGPLSGAEPELLQSAFIEMGESDVQLVIHEIPLQVRCLSCNEVSSMVQFVCICPRCQSIDLQIIGGDTLRLLHVTMTESVQGLQS